MALLTFEIEIHFLRFKIQNDRIVVFFQRTKNAIFLDAYNIEITLSTQETNIFWYRHILPHKVDIKRDWQTFYFYQHVIDKVISRKVFLFERTKLLGCVFEREAATGGN